MHITDLRQLNSRKLQPLLEEEARHWLDELRWDYRPSMQLIQRFVDARTLTGYAALDNGQPAGYGFYVVEQHKGLIGGLYVSPSRGPGQAEISRVLLGEMLTSLRGTPRLERVEAQLMPFGAAFDNALLAENFHLYTRQFMLLELRPGHSWASETNPTSSPALRLEPWQEHCFAPCARLIQLAYADHVDSEINDQYRSEAGAMKFLRNITVLRGCGQFLPEASFVLRPATSGAWLRSAETDPPLGMVLTSAVSSGVGHTTQICVLPGYHRRGLGQQLMEASLRALQSLGYRALSLTVTSSNVSAVRLYERLGFRTIKIFSAAVWEG